MRYLNWLLLPLSWLYGFIMDFRNHLYDAGVLKSFRFDLPVIVVGNLSVGGTGKTPMIEYIIRLLRKEYKVATLSRGYKRRTKGFRIAGPSDNAVTLGDEPFQLYHKFEPEVTVSVGEDRVYSIPFILECCPETEVVILDDAFQHRRLKASLQILITDYGRFFYEDRILPAGRLREPRKNARRADAVVVSKCPQSLPEKEKLRIIKRVQYYAGTGKPVFFAYIDYGKPVPVMERSGPVSNRIILVTGVANPDPLVRFLSGKHEIIKHFKFPDHHFFSAGEMDSMLNYFDQLDTGSFSVLFTEKDFYRITNTAYVKKLTRYPIYFQPITYKFVEYGKEFDQMILESIRQFTN